MATFAPVIHRRYRSRAAFLAAVLATALGFGACSNPGAAASGKPVVLCTIFSYYDAARAIAGDAADVRILLPAFASPHEYALNSQDRFSAARAKLYIKNGAGLDDRFDNLITDRNATKVLTISEAIPKSELLKGVDDHDHAGNDHTAHAEAAGMNPHIWLDPTLQIAAAEKIRDALVAMDPAHKVTFEANATKYIESLRKLDADFKASAETFKTKKFIGFHSAYDYLARRYGLEQIASVEEVAGSGLTVERAKEVIDLIRKNNIKYLAVETALSGKGADLIKQETGVETIILQPLETYDDPANTYESLMRQNLESLKKMLGAG
jgi:zinc transport system substrate-binding protein